MEHQLEVRLDGSELLRVGRIYFPSRRLHRGAHLRKQHGRARVADVDCRGVLGSYRVAQKLPTACLGKMVLVPGECRTVASGSFRYDRQSIGLGPGRPLQPIAELAQIAVVIFTLVPDLHGVAQTRWSHARAVVANAHPPTARIGIREDNVDLPSAMRQAIVHQIGHGAGQAVPGTCQDFEETERVRRGVIIVADVVVFIL
ncbi:hypothetical protein D3C77_322530 [compost metagenome]